MINIYGTIGPACANPEILKDMFREGMTGMRLNTSHMSVKEAAPQIRMIREAAAASGVEAQILIDMQGPELRIARMAQQMTLEADQRICFREETCEGDGIPLPKMVYEALKGVSQFFLMMEKFSSNCLMITRQLSAGAVCYPEEKALHYQV